MTALSAKPLASPMRESITWSLAAAAAMLCVALLLGTGVARAATTSKKASADAKSAKTPLLTPAELRACLTQKEGLRAQTDDALKDKTAIDADKAEITRSGTELADQVATLDKTSAEDVDAFNARVGERDKLIDAYQAKVTAYNAKAAAVQTAKDSYEKACASRRYDERDENDLKRKK